MSILEKIREDAGRGLSNFTDTEHSQRGNYIRNRILLSLAAGAVNVILLVFFVLTLR